MKQSLGAKTLICPTPTWVVGSYDEQGKANAATVAWSGICCSDPPCVAVSLRKATYTHGNLMARRAFTLHVPSQHHAQQADYFGLVSGRDVDKLAAAGFTAVRSELVDAPIVAEFPMVLECRVLHVFELGLHTQFVGQIMDVKVDQTMLCESGLPDMGKLLPILFSPGEQRYYGLGKPIGPAFEMGKP